MVFGTAGNDSLTVDFERPFELDNGISFNADLGDGDVLSVLGTQDVDEFEITSSEINGVGLATVFTSSVEEVTVSGTGENDSFNVDRPDGLVRIEGGSGTDTLTVTSGNVQSDGVENLVAELSEEAMKELRRGLESLIETGTNLEIFEELARVLPLLDDKLAEIAFGQLLSFRAVLEELHNDFREEFFDPDPGDPDDPEKDSLKPEPIDTSPDAVNAFFMNWLGHDAITISDTSSVVGSVEITNGVITDVFFDFKTSRLDSIDLNETEDLRNIGLVFERILTMELMTGFDFNLNSCRQILR